MQGVPGQPERQIHGLLALGRRNEGFRLAVVPGRTPVFRGTRVPFQALLDYLEGGQTLAELFDDFPTVTREVAIASLERAKSLLVGQLG